MSREAAAACPLSAAELPLLAAARLIPETALLELRAASGRVGDPVRRLFLHVAACDTCAPEALVGEARICDHGRRLVDAARGWLERRTEGPQQ